MTRTVPRDDDVHRILVRGVEDNRPLCQFSSKRSEDNWHSGLLSSTNYRLSGRPSPDRRRVLRTTGIVVFCPLQGAASEQSISLSHSPSLCCARASVCGQSVYVCMLLYVLVCVCCVWRPF